MPDILAPEEVASANALQDNGTTSDPSSSGQPSADPANAIVPQPAPQTPQPMQGPVPQGQQASQPQQGQPSSQGGQSPQPDPLNNHPAVQRASVLRKVGETLAGGERVKTTIDPQTGKVTREKTPLSSREILMGALANALSGIGHISSNLSDRMEGRRPDQNFQLPTQAAQQKQAQQATDDYNRQQQLKVRQMQTAEANMRMYGLAQQLGRNDKDQHDKAGENYKDSIDAYTDQGAVANDNASAQEAQDVQKYPIGQYLRIPKPGGAVPRTNANGQRVFMTPEGEITTEDSPKNTPLWDNRYVIVDNKAQTPLRETSSEQTGPNTTTKTSGALLPWVKDAQFYGLGGPQFSQAGDRLGASMPAAPATNLHHQVAGLDGLASELDSFAKKTGQTWTDKDGNQVDARHYLQQKLKDNPSLLSSIDQWRRTAAGGSTEPDNQILDKMSSDPKAQAARSDLIQLFGGADNLEKYKEDRESRIAANKTSAEEVAKENTPKGKQQLTNEQLTAEKDRLEIDKLKKDQPSDLPTGQIVNGVDATAMKALPVGKQRAAQMLMDGRMEMSPQALRTAFGSSWVTDLATLFPGDATHEGFDSTKAKSYEKLRQDYTSGKSFQRIQATNNALGHLQQYLDSSDALRVTAPGSHALALKGIYGKQAQDQAKSRDAAIEFISEETAKATKGGVPDKAEVERIRGILETAIPSESQSAAKAVANIIKTPIDNLQSGWESGVPFGMVSPLTHLMSPEAMNAYTKLTGEKPNFGPGRPVEPTAQTGGGGQLIQNQGAGTQPMYASAPGKPRMMSNDGGKTWQPAQ